MLAEDCASIFVLLQDRVVRFFDCNEAGVICSSRVERQDSVVATDDIAVLAKLYRRVVIEYL